MNSLKKIISKSQLLRINIGIIYLWFGGLKFFHHLSPAEMLATETIQRLTFHLIPQDLNYLMLALGETVLGLMLILNLVPRLTIKLAIAHMVCTFLPLVLIPEMVFGDTAFSLTLSGQYIIKNLVIISALLIIYPRKGMELRVTKTVEEELKKAG